MAVDIRRISFLIGTGLSLVAACRVYLNGDSASPPPRKPEPEAGQFDEEVMMHDPDEDDISLETLRILVDSSDPTIAQAAKDIVVRRYIRQPDAYTSIAKQIATGDEQTRAKAVRLLRYISQYSSNGTRTESNQSNNSPEGRNFDYLDRLNDPIRWSGLGQIDRRSTSWSQLCPPDISLDGEGRADESFECAWINRQQGLTEEESEDESFYEDHINRTQNSSTPQVSTEGSDASSGDAHEAESLEARMTEMTAVFNNTEI